jgi:Tfp pilus assembly major pilin PilA
LVVYCMSKEVFTLIGLVVVIVILGSFFVTALKVY